MLYNRTVNSSTFCIFIVLLTDVSKTKEFVSDTTSTSSVPVICPRQSKASDLKTVIQADRKNDHRSEKGSSPSKSLKSNSTESVKTDGSSVSKSSSSSASVTKKDLSSSEAGSSNIENIIPAAPSITGEKSLTNYRKDHPAAKKETKPTKIRVKVIQKGMKDKSKRAVVSYSESTQSSTSKDDSKESTGEKIAKRTREERQKKFNTIVDGLIKADEKMRQQFLETMSKRHVKVFQKVDKLLKKRLGAVVAKPLTAKIPTPPPPPVLREASPISIADELMDLTEDKNDLILVSGPSTSKAEEKTTISTDTKLDLSEVDVMAHE